MTLWGPWLLMLDMMHLHIIVNFFKGVILLCVRYMMYFTFVLLLPSGKMRLPLKQLRL